MAPENWPAELTQKWKITVGAGDVTPALEGGLKAGTPYRVAFDYDGKRGQFQASLTDMSDLSLAGQVNGAAPDRVGL